MKLSVSVIKSTLLGAFAFCAMTFAQMPPTPPAQTPPEGAQRLPGVFSFDENASGQIVRVPESVRPGQEFQVVITTVGGGCEEQGDQGVVLGMRSAEIHVYDFTTATRPDTVCTAIIKRFEHTVTLNFPEPGVYALHVWGRQTGRYYPNGGAPVVLTVPVTVNP